MIYLIHFQEAIGSDKHKARHYLGFIKGTDLAARLNWHRKGWGAKILAHCNKQGIEYDIVRTMPGDRDRERQIKRTKNLSHYCPVCRAKHPTS